MSKKIISIKEKIPVDSTLPDGTYSGIWGGYIIELKYNNKTYELTTEDGVKGFNIKVVVCIKDGVATFESIKN